MTELDNETVLMSSNKSPEDETAYDEAVETNERVISLTAELESKREERNRLSDSIGQIHHEIAETRRNAEFVGIFDDAEIPGLQDSKNTIADLEKQLKDLDETINGLVKTIRELKGEKKYIID